MGKYIDYFYLNNARYYISADFANSATKMSSVASSYSFDIPVEIWDDFVHVTLDHPYKYSGPQPVTILNPTAVGLTENSTTTTSSLNVYDASFNVISAANAKMHVMPSYDLNDQSNAFFTESIYGHLTQTATVTEQVSNQQWVVPVTFKIASYYDTNWSCHLDNEYIEDNLWADDGWHGGKISPSPEKMQFLVNDYQIWGTTIPAVLFRDAGIANIPVYKASNTAYQLNVDIFNTIGNVGHVGDTSNNEFVKFINNLQNISDCNIVSGTIKANSYAATSVIYSAATHTQIGVKNYRVLSANVTDTSYSVGTLHDPNLNALKYAFYDVNRNYQALAIDNNTIYDEYTYYCEMPASVYATSAAATAAIQNAIDSCNYVELTVADDYYLTHSRGTIPDDAQVFNFHDKILKDWNHESSIVMNGSRIIDIVPTRYDVGGGEYHRITAVRTDRIYKYNDVNTVITKPSIKISEVKQVATTAYTYSFGGAYVVNSAFTGFDSTANQTIYKSDSFNMIQYSTPEVAPVEQCRATCAGFDTLCGQYFNFCDTVYRQTTLPSTTAAEDVRKGMIPVVLGHDTTTTTHLTNLPTRDIYFCITMSK